jgi:alkaline phosphatase
MLGLFAGRNMAFEVDRNASKEPSLREMVEKALSILSKSSEGKENGFFIMIEGSQIGKFEDSSVDIAAHRNDPATHITELLAYHEMVKSVKAFVDANPGTIVISTSDHETGGFTVGRQIGEAYPVYGWNPERLFRVKKSTTEVAKLILSFYDDHPGSTIQDKVQFVKETVLKNWMAISDYTTDELDSLANQTDSLDLIRILGNALSVRAQLGWTTSGHTAVDVNLYVYSNLKQQSSWCRWVPFLDCNQHDVDLPKANVENVELGQFVADALQLDLEHVTRILRKGRLDTGAEMQLALEDHWTNQHE